MSGSDPGEVIRYTRFEREFRTYLDQPAEGLLDRYRRWRRWRSFNPSFRDIADLIERARNCPVCHGTCPRCGTALEPWLGAVGMVNNDHVTCANGHDDVFMYNFRAL